MSNYFPIPSLPPELVQQWHDECHKVHEPFLVHIANQAARWGADQELEACCEWVRSMFGGHPTWADELRAARRPKPPSLNEVALQMLGTIERDAHYIPEITDTIRRALEALPND